MPDPRRLLTPMNRLLPLAVANEDWVVVRGVLPYVAFGLLVLLAGFGVLWLRKEWPGLAGAAWRLWRWLMRNDAEVTGCRVAARAGSCTGAEPHEGNRRRDRELLVVVLAAASEVLAEGEQIVALQPVDRASEYNRHLWAWPAEGRRQHFAGRERLAIPEVPAHSCGRAADGWRSVGPAGARE